MLKNVSLLYDFLNCEIIKELQQNKSDGDMSVIHRGIYRFS